MPMLKTQDSRIHYQTVGDGEDIVLIHGLGANLAFWYWGVGRILARKHRVLMYDLRGHGRSSMPDRGYRLSNMCDDLRLALDKLDVAQPHIVGHSYGARVALQFAGLYPERTRSLTVADTQILKLQPSVRLRDWPHWRRWKQELSSAGMEVFPPDDSVIDYNLLAYFNHHSNEIVNRGRRANFNRISMKSRDMGLKGAGRWDRLLEKTTAGTDLTDESPLTPDLIRSISAPTLLAYGEYSHCLKTSEALLPMIADSRRVMVPGAGHFHPAVKPRIFASLLLQFLRSEDLTIN